MFFCTTCRMTYIGKWLLSFSIEAFLPIEPPTEVTLRNAAISLVCSCVPFSALAMHTTEGAWDSS